MCNPPHDLDKSLGNFLVLAPLLSRRFRGTPLVAISTQPLSCEIRLALDAGTLMPSRIPPRAVVSHKRAVLGERV